MFKTIIKNTSWLFLAEIINKVVFFVITILIARGFGNEAYGQFNYALSLVIIFSVVADFGINNLIIREIARKRKMSNVLIGNSFFIKIFLSFLTLVLIFITTTLIGKTTKANILTYILAFYTIFNSYNTFSKSVFRAFEKMEFEALLKIVEGITLMFYTIIMVFVLKNLILFAMGFAFASFIAFIVSIIWIKKFFTNFSLKLDYKIILHIIKESWPFAITNIFMIIYFHLDTAMISWIKGDIETGLYSASYNFVFLALLIPSLLNSSFYPVLSRKYEGLQKIKISIAKYISILVTIGLFMSIFIFLLAPFLINIIYGKEFQSSILSLRILVMAFPFMFFSNFMGTLLASTNRQKLNLSITMVSVLVNILLNLRLIQLYGQIGASLASFIAITLMAVLCIPIWFKFINKTSLIQEMS